MTHFKRLHKDAKWLRSTLRLAPTPAPAGDDDEIEELDADGGMDIELGNKHNKDKNGFDDDELRKDKNDKIVGEVKNDDDMLDIVINNGEQEKDDGEQEKESEVIVIDDDDDDNNEDEEEDK